MGFIGSQAGDNGAIGLVPLYGYQDDLSLDARGRFRVPDELASLVQRALGQAQAQAVPAGAPPTYQRLAFYFVPGPGRRIFLYPVTNIGLAIERFENPPAGIDPQALRDARDYFYQTMRYVEADKQNRFQVPDGLRRHARLDDDVDRVSLVAHNNYLVLAPSQEVERALASKLDAFEQAAPDLLDPAYGTPAPLPGAEMAD